MFYVDLLIRASLKGMSILLPEVFFISNEADRVEMYPFALSVKKFRCTTDT